MNKQTSSSTRRRKARTCYGCGRPLAAPGAGPFHGAICFRRWSLEDDRDEARTLEGVTRRAALPWREEGRA